MAGSPKAHPFRCSSHGQQPAGKLDDETRTFGDGEKEEEYEGGCDGGGGGRCGRSRGRGRGCVVVVVVVEEVHELLLVPVAGTLIVSVSWYCTTTGGVHRTDRNPELHGSALK
ncbi:hypothetical protein M0802_006675 [Mischocyttarus mexicanus]|nr:hypothetical protein M0802_006675 [Mischocyttarus mexicanus]